MSDGCPSCVSLRAEIDRICALGSDFPVTLEVSKHLVPADRAARAAKTPAWQTFAAREGVEDLVTRAERMYFLALEAHKRGLEAEGDELGAGAEDLTFFGRYTLFVDTLGHGLLEPFSSATVRPYILESDPDASIKHRVLDALDVLSARYAGRVPSLLWEALAFVALRNEAFEDRSIIGDALAYKDTVARWHYTFYDACLHALGKVYSLLLDVQTEISSRAGVVLIHNCDCGCSLVRLARTGTVSVSLEPHFRKKATESFLTHVLTEGIVLMRYRLPFVTGVGDDAAAALALEGQGLL